jgi:hypothetical protein
MALMPLYAAQLGTEKKENKKQRSNFVPNTGY